METNSIVILAIAMAGIIVPISSIAILKVIPQNGK